MAKNEPKKDSHEYPGYIVRKFNEMQFEIIEAGWAKIAEQYHPDNNYKNPNAFELFKLYKEIYEGMKIRLYISEEGDPRYNE